MTQSSESLTNFVQFQFPQRARNNAIKITQGNQNQILPVVSNQKSDALAVFPELAGLNFVTNAYLHDLQAISRINSGGIPKSTMPNYDYNQTEGERVMATLQFEWGTAMMELRVFSGSPSGQWIEYGASAIKNVTGHRYRRHTLIDLLTDNPTLQIEQGWKIGVMLEDVGLGSLLAGDEVHITASWVQEVIVAQRQPYLVQVNNFGGGGSTPAPTYTPAVALSLPEGMSSAYILEKTAIAYSLTDCPPNETFTLTWQKDGTDLTANSITGTTSELGEATGSLTADNFSLNGAGNYKAKIVIGSYTAVSTIAVNMVGPSVALNKSAITNSSTETFTVTVGGLTEGSTFELRWTVNGVVQSNLTTTHTFNTANPVYSFTGNKFSQAATYRVRFWKDGIYRDSETTLVVTLMPVVTLTLPSGVLKAYLLSNTQLTASGINFTPNSNPTGAWLKGGVSAASFTVPITAQGTYTNTFGCDAFKSSPYGTGYYQFRLAQGGINYDSSPTIHVVSSVISSPNGYYQYLNSGSAMSIRATNAENGKTHTLQLFKNGVLVNGFSKTAVAASNQVEFSISSAEYSNSPLGAGNYGVQITCSGATTINNDVFIVSSGSSGGGTLG